MWPIERIERSGRTWHVFNRENPGRGVIIPFPNAMFSVATNQISILSHTGCNDAIAYLHSLIKDLLKGGSWFLYAKGLISNIAYWTMDINIYSEVDEVTARVKNAPLKIMRRQSSALRMSSCTTSSVLL